MDSTNFVFDKVNNVYRPTLYPGEKSDNWDLPEKISSDHTKLNSIIESKYSIEYLKICAFYNKMFHSLKTSEWSQSAYNAPMFTVMDQERTDTGSGVNFNYLKQIVDQITSRLGTITFLPRILSEDQSFEYIVYKDEVERILRQYVRNDNFNRVCLEVFHNAAVVGYAHVFIDPYTGSLIKANDYEIGMYESQFNKGHITNMLYRDYAFPVTDALHYLVDCDDAKKEEIIALMQGKSTVDFKMYFDCLDKKVYVTINNYTLPAHDYPFEYVLVRTFSWDTGFSKYLTSSEFDLLYPIQREINKIAAKKQQLIRMYKGSVPVFSSDVDLAMKSITNGSGEALYIDSTRNPAELMTVINPTPLDPQLDAEIQSYKTAMYELAGIQNASFDMENMRSAAAVVALDQTRDSVFQAQLAGLAQFIKDCLRMYMQFFAVYPEYSHDNGSVDWEAINRLVDRCYIDLKPVHLNDPMSDEDEDTGPVDYMEQAISRATLNVIKGKLDFDTLPYYINWRDITLNIAYTYIKFEALGVKIPDTIQRFLIKAFVKAIETGDVLLQ